MRKQVRRRQKPTRIRIMADYCCSWPVWGEGSGLHDGDEELDISDGLRQDLLAWQEFWEEHQHGQDGWVTPEAADAWESQGLALQRRLQRELDEPVEFRR